VDEGRFVDLIEVDAASRTKVEQTRELLENVPYAPVKGRYKVYLIDEVHMFSDSSFNALLKTLEEPPPHVKFLLATTDPQKLPMTVLSRCLQFGLKRLTLEQITNQLRHILQTEGLLFDEAALTLLAFGADGSMRDGLSLLDQAISFGAGQVIEEQVATMLGTVSRDYVFGLLEALVARDGVLLIQKISELASRAPDFQQVLDELLRMLHRVTVLQTVPNLNVENDIDHERFAWLVDVMQPDEVQLYYQIGLIGKRDLPLAPDMRSGFEMTLLRMLAFQPDQAVTAAPTAPVTASASKKPTSARPPAAAKTAVKAKTAAAASTAAPIQAAAVQPNAVRETPPIAKSKNTMAAAKLSANLNWHALQEVLNLGGVSRQLAANCALDAVDLAKLKISLVLPEQHQALRSDMAQERMQRAVRDHFQQENIMLEIRLGTTEQETPAQHAQRQADSRLAEAKADMVADPFVQAAQKHLGARVIDASIRPRKST
jgi:DNA polymerase-3 subunit gamma/tau